MRIRYSPYLLIVAVVFLGAWLRLAAFDLMEFKNDEAAAIILARGAAETGLTSTGMAGMMSGAGIRNPPGFILLLLPIAALSSSPLVFGVSIAVFNIAALGIILLLGRELRAPLAGFWACAFLAAHPWHILYSRKIWAQSLLPVFVLHFLRAIARCERVPKSRAAFFPGLLAGLIWQIHYSGYCVVFFCAVWLIATAARKKLNCLFAVLGIVLGAGLLVPYALYLRTTGFRDLLLSFSGPWFGGANAGTNLAGIVRGFAATAFSGGFGYPFSPAPAPLSATPLGEASPWLSPAAFAATGLILILAAAGAFSRFRKKEIPVLARCTPWLLFFTLTPPLLYFVRGIETPPHYFLLSFPAVLFLAGAGMENVLSWAAAGKSGDGRKWNTPSAKGIMGGAAALLGMLIVFAGVNVWSAFIGYIGKTGGTGGDYGLAYRVQEKAVDALVEERVGRLDTGLMRDEGIGVRYLLYLRRGDYAPDPAVHGRLIDTLLFPGRACSPYRFETTERTVGPLIICFSEIPMSSSNRDLPS
ncbi:MAG: hypothetical protein NTV79_01980, partial [Candidatus Aureabacteria bacterium]|nr:hypothetical protein [Candidatus Auribacterota bacterium]